MTRSSTKNFIGLLLLIGVGLVILSIAMSQGTISTASQQIKNTLEFAGGEKITIYELPELLTPEQKEALEKYGELEFFVDPQYRELAEEQEITGQRDLLEEQRSTVQENEELNEIQKEEAHNGTIKTSVSKVEGTRANISGLQEVDLQGNVWVRGEIIQFAGKIEKNLTPPPYFYNTIATCCEMPSFRAQSGVQTDSFGNFLVKIPTSGQFPLGDWVVEISTIADDRSIIKHKYEFKLVAPPE